MEELRTGQFWYHEAWGKRAIAQWLTGDVWVLLNAPGPARHGGTCMMAIGTKDGKIFYTKAELQKKLEEAEWQYTRARLVVEEATVSYI